MARAKPAPVREHIHDELKRSQAATGNEAIDCKPGRYKQDVPIDMALMLSLHPQNRKRTLRCSSALRDSRSGVKEKVNLGGGIPPLARPAAPRTRREAGYGAPGRQIEVLAIAEQDRQPEKGTGPRGVPSYGRGSTSFNSWTFLPMTTRKRVPKMSRNPEIQQRYRCASTSLLCA